MFPYTFIVQPRGYRGHIANGGVAVNDNFTLACNHGVWRITLDFALPAGTRCSSLAPTYWAKLPPPPDTLALRGGPVRICASRAYDAVYFEPRPGSPFAVFLYNLWRHWSGLYPVKCTMTRLG